LHIPHRARVGHLPTNGEAGTVDIESIIKTGQGERPFNPRHHVLGEGFKWQDGDVLVISPMDSPEIARWVEKVVISDFMAGPPFTTRCS
jgi:hypothetical protein